ncbi:hypothetical protein [Saccharibacillus sp. JS10]|uniref:hypothetical protein n=1 Tax=Saccharibacillus sp. JS10 TaxID=2950552 RepID=UPI00210C5D68|nr:hypothetical protein [Saccharibacillus sp. JS10]MCQ4085448.1 hypothetical protein [Saccharibacillus sp. JS10]
MYIVSRDLIEQSGIDDPQLTLSVIEETLRGKAAGTSVFAQEVAMKRGKPEHGAFYSLPAYLGATPEASGVAGLKWTSHMPRSNNQALPYTQPIILLNDLESGQPIALLEGELISGLRTGAVSAAAARALAHPSAGSLLICGSGFQAFYQLRSLLPVLPNLKELHLWSRNPEHAKQLQEKFQVELDKRGITVRIHLELPNRLDFVEIIVGVTSAAEPYLNSQHFVNGHLYLHVGMRDVSSDAIEAFDHIVCDDYAAGVPSSSQSLFVHAREYPSIENKVKLLENVSDTNVIKQNSSTKLMFNAFGLSIFDLALAREALQRLRRSDNLAHQPLSFNLTGASPREGGD